ncbi:MAG TPA: glycoside hydrolase family 28 protein [Opitutaceae bacterium]|jgi:polygalacturonase
MRPPSRLPWHRLLLLPALIPLACASAAQPGQYNILDYGAAPDGKSLCTQAFARAVAACEAAGGGTVEVPAGRYLTGSIELRSNIRLNLEAGAEVLYNPNPADSPIVASRWESTNAFLRAALVHAEGAVNVSITGHGTLNGQGANWWWRTGTYDPARAAEVKPAKQAWLGLYKRIEAGEKPGAGEFILASEYLRPPLVELNGCTNVAIEDVTVTESPMWLLHPVYCENVSIRGVTFLSTGPNGDGIDIDSCRDVRISDCFFSTGDDCIVIKSGRNADGRRTARPTEHVTISNCVMYKGHGAVVIGSETSGGIRDIAADNIVCRGTLRGVRIKSERGRGNTIENARFSNFVIDGALEEAIEITALYEDEPAEPFSSRTPVFRNLAFSSFTIVGAAQVASIHGLPEKDFEELRFSDITASGTRGFICDHASDMELHNVRVRATEGSPFAFTSVSDLELDGAACPAPLPSQPVIRLEACSGVWIHASRAAAGTGTFVEQVSMKASEVHLGDNYLSAASGTSR